MTTKTINEEIETIAEQCINQKPKPTRCKILKIYDKDYVDVETENGTIEYVPTIANNLKVGNIGVIIFLNGSETDCIVISK